MRDQRWQQQGSKRRRQLLLSMPLKQRLHPVGPCCATTVVRHQSLHPTPLC